MKKIGVVKVAFLLISIGVIGGLAGSGSMLMAAEMNSGAGALEKNDPRKNGDYIEGRIDYIEDSFVTINDQGYRLTNSTHYRTAGGGVTGKNHFSIGDKVKYIISPEFTELVELRLLNRSNDEKESTKKNRDSGNMQLEDGVWVN